MENLPLAVGLIVMGYLAGSLPMGVIVARLTGGTDPRTVGSGRTGGTNALRAMGWPRAILVGLLDLAKGAVPILVARAAGAPVEVQALTGVAAVLGSWKSVFLRFHGGRGVATGVGGMLAISPLICLVAAPAFFLIIVMTRYVSLGSLLGTAFGALLVAPLRAGRLARAGLAPLRRARPGHRVDRASRQHRASAGGHGAPLRPLGPPSSAATGQPGRRGRTRGRPADLTVPRRRC